MSEISKLPRIDTSPGCQLEQALRIDVAAGFRLLHRHGMSDLIAGNIGARLPGADWFLTHPHGYFFDEMKASDLIRVDLAGKPLDGPDDRVHFSAVEQASRAFEARPDVNVVLHAHGLPVMAVSALQRGLLPISEPAFMFYQGVAYIEADFHFDDDYMRRFSAALAGNRVVVYQNHAFLVVATTVAEAFLTAYMFNQACELQLLVLATGDPVVMPSEEAAQRHYASFFGNPNACYDGSAEWPGLLRSLDRVDPSFRQ